MGNATITRISGSTSQFTLAQDFYEAATPNEFSPGNTDGATNIITTGHSLGGALADNDDDVMPAAFAVG